MADSIETTGPALLTIGSWNVGLFNSHIVQIQEYLANSPAHIFCLQEVSEVLRAKLMAKPGSWTMAYEIESIRTKPGGHEVVAYCMILVRKPAVIILHGPGRFDELPAPTGRKKFLIDTLTKLKKHDGVSRKNSFMYADIGWQGHLFRVFSAHFRWASAEERNADWDALHALFLEGKVNIPAGDFNLFDTLPGAILNWFLGGRFRNIFMPKADRRHKEELFWNDARLNNPLAHEITHKSWAGDQQLDHILTNVMTQRIIPDSVNAEKFDSYGKFRGSDHAAVTVTVQFLEKAT